jgi:hypothetical protein
MTGNLLIQYMGIGKNGSSKRSRNPASFYRFFKKSVRAPINLRKSSLAKTYSTTHPIKAASDKTLPKKHGPKGLGQKTQPSKRAAKSGNP